MKLWTLLSDLGTKNVSSFESKRVRLVNRLCFILLSISFLFIFPWFFEKNLFMVAGNFVLMVFYGFAIFLNAKELHSLATGAFLFITSTGVFIISGMMGGYSALHYTLTSFSAMAIVLFNRTEKFKIALGIIYPLILLFILIITDFKILPDFIQQRNNLLITFDYIVNFCVIMTTILCFYSFYIQAEDKYRLLYEDHLKAQDQLNKEKAKAMVSSKMAALGEMAGSISHEINNPLFVIKATVSTLIKEISQNKTSNEEILDKCHTIEKTSSIISDIIRSLKTISGSSETCPFESHDIKVLIADTLILSKHRFHLASIPLNVFYETENTIIKVRPVDLVQVLVNLLNNAYDALQGIKDAHVNIRVKEEDSYLTINVEDNGIGIPAEIQDKVFDTFYTSKTPDKGTGLGLSLSKKLTNNNHGEISFTSSPGKTVFALKFPQELPPYIGVKPLR
ncbi:MAG TPA: HAMP domain-containing sensor histidine kinase [Bacteriovoracaceae bacterium]|nr:HAMP domain-containing sensor histidine kinase [Bacteriovoracaceae bacterium]